MISQQDEIILDVTAIEPKHKHPTIFQYFDALEPGESFVISNDHDPKPLYYQMLGERGQTFYWEYLEEGPETWKVRLTKMTGEQQETVGELAAKDLRKAEVFKKYGIDFCCGGSKTLDEACEEKGLDKESVEKELEGNQTQAMQFVRFNQWKPAFLADFIVENHHQFVKNRIPEIKKYLHKIAQVHGPNHPELHNLKDAFSYLADELKHHMKKEEDILFPYVRELQEAVMKNRTTEKPHFGSVENPIRMMEQEHQNAGDNMENIRRITSDYTPPEDACASYHFAFQMLEEFDGDLHQHIHLENNILFPEAKKMEEWVSGAE